MRSKNPKCSNLKLWTIAFPPTLPKIRKKEKKKSSFGTYNFFSPLLQTVSFLTYLLKSFADYIRPHEESICKSIVNLLVTCSDSVSIRKVISSCPLMIFSIWLLFFPLFLNCYMKLFVVGIVSRLKACAWYRFQEGFISFDWYTIGRKVTCFPCKVWIPIIEKPLTMGLSSDDVRLEGLLLCLPGLIKCFYNITYKKRKIKCFYVITYKKKRFKCFYSSTCLLCIFLSLFFG